MPPRWLVVLIVLGWAATTFHLVFWDFLPSFSSNTPAPVFIALSDETVGSRSTNRWLIKRDGVEVMRASSGLDYEETPRETFRFWMEFTPVHGNAGFLQFRLLRTEFTTGRSGFLLSMKSRMEVEGPPGLPLASENEMVGEVEGSLLRRKVVQKLLNTTRKDELPPLEIGSPPMVWFPFMPVWRLNRLSRGSQWRVMVVDPLGDMVSSGQGRVSGQMLQVEVLRNDEPCKDDPKAPLCRRIRATAQECQIDLWVDPDSGRVMKQEVVLEFRHRWSIEREE